MALIECDECGAQISDKASACPKCGNPLKANKQDVIYDTLKKRSINIKTGLKSRKFKLFIGSLCLLVFIVAIWGGFFGFADYYKIDGITENYNHSDYTNAYIHLSGKFYTRIAFVFGGLVFLWIAKWCLIPKRSILANIIYCTIVILSGGYMVNHYIKTKNAQEYRLQSCKIEQQKKEAMPEFKKSKAGADMLKQELKNCTFVKYMSDMPDDVINNYCNGLNELSIKTWNKPLNGLGLQVFQATYTNDSGDQITDRFYVFFKDEKPIKFAGENIIREWSELDILYLMIHNFE